MSKKLIIGTTVSILTISIIGVAFAKHRYHAGHHDHMHSKYMMKKADKNNDGKITKDELQQAQLERFKKIDANNDGVINAAEVQKRMSRFFEKRAKRMTRRFDENRDGKVTQEEFLAAADKRLYILDLNDDGEITRDVMRGGHYRKGWHHKRGSHNESKDEVEKSND